MRHVLILAALLTVSPVAASETDGWYPGKLLGKPKPHPQAAPQPEAARAPVAIEREPLQPIIIYHLPPVQPEPAKPTWTDKVAKGWNWLKVGWDAGHIFGSIGLLLLTLLGFRRGTRVAAFSAR